MFNWEDCYMSYLNLDSRVDRLILMQDELKRVGLMAERTRGKLPQEFDLTDPKLQVQVNRTPGSIGCWHGQCEIMQKAFDLGKSAFVCEDDLIFCSDLKKRLDYIQDFVNKQNSWDVVWLGGTVHINPPFWHTGVNPDLMGSYMRGDAEYVGDERIFRSYGSFSTHCYLVNYESIQKVLKMLDSVEHEAMGIDWAFIKLAPQLNNFVHLPGCVIQRNNRSDIGMGDTIFSSFSSLGAHWFADKLEDFKFDNYNWGEAYL